jgi:hypothetical protein
MIEHESHSHAHHTGLPWLDWSSLDRRSLSRLFLCIVSIQHGSTIEKLVAANEKQVEASTLPIVRFTTGNLLEPVKDPGDLLTLCCRSKTQRAGSVWQNVASGMTLPAGQSESIFQIRAADADPDSYRLLDTDARFRIEAESCYCSVLDECWITYFKVQPRKVKTCEPIPDNQRW